MDRRAIDKSQLIEAQAAQEYFEEGVVPVATSLKSSAKIKALLEILKYLDADSKSFVPFLTSPPLRVNTDRS